MRYAIAILVLLLSACSADKGMAVESRFAELMGRPDIDAAAKRYDEMRTKIRDKLTSERLAGEWSGKEDTASVLDCTRDFAADVRDTEARAMKQWVSAGNLPDDKWQAAVLAVAGVARDYGFGEPLVVVDRPGDHELSIKDGYGAEILFSTLQNTVLSLITGCHLTAEAHQRGTPSR